MQDICAAIIAAGGTPVLVGGIVRDFYVASVKVREQQGGTPFELGEQSNHPAPWAPIHRGESGSKGDRPLWCDSKGDSSWKKSQWDPKGDSPLKKKLLLFLSKAEKKDLDIEVYGLSEPALARALTPFTATLVGKAFGVYRIQQEGIHSDVALPRLERHRSHKHNDVAVTLNPDMSFAEASKRRDFTVNAMGIVWQTGALLDPYNGMQDVQNGVIRHVGPAFVEDPLRVFRAARFAARFGWDIATETQKLCQTMALDMLAPERVWGELLLMLSENPKTGLAWYRRLGCLSWFPELAALIGVPQDPHYHPEGDAWTHICLTVAAVGAQGRQSFNDSLPCSPLTSKVFFSGDCRPQPPHSRKILQPFEETFPTCSEGSKGRQPFEKKSFCSQSRSDWEQVLHITLLCHDLGKATTTAWQKGRWRAIGHEHVGVRLSLIMLQRLKAPVALQNHVALLVKYHMRPVQLYAASQKQKVSDTAIRRLASQVPLPELAAVATADYNGRGGDFDPEPPPVAWLRQRAQNLGVWDAQPIPVIRGRDLIDVGYQPGPKLGKILAQLFQAQLAGRFGTHEEGIAFVRRRRFD